MQLIYVSFESAVPSRGLSRARTLLLVHPSHRLKYDRERLIVELIELEKAGVKLVTWSAFEGCCVDCRDRAGATSTIVEARELLRTPFCRQSGCRCEVKAHETPGVSA